MSRKEKLPPELTAFEAELASLRPDMGSLDTGRLMFLAGQESVERRPHGWTALVWPTAFTAMTAMAAVLLVLLVSHPRPEVVERIVRVEVPVQVVDATQATPDDPAAKTAIASAAEDGQPMIRSTSNGYVHRLLASVFFNHSPAAERIPLDGHQLSYQELRDHLIENGIDSWPMQTPARPHRTSNKPMTREELMQELLSENG